MEKNSESFLVLDIPDENSRDYVWQCKGSTLHECAEKFLKEKLWDGHNFYEAESEIEWTDW